MLFDFISFNSVILYCSVLSRILISYLVDQFVSPQVVLLFLIICSPLFSTFQRQGCTGPSTLLLMEMGQTSPTFSVFGGSWLHRAIICWSEFGLSWYKLKRSIMKILLSALLSSTALMPLLFINSSSTNTLPGKYIGFLL